MHFRIDRRDPLFFAALAAGPLVCLLLALLPGIALTAGMPPPGWLALVLSVLVYPVLEEIVFRGGLQPWLADHSAARLGPLTLANGVTTAVFTALHFIYHPPLWALGVLIPSLVFGYFRERHNSVGAPIALHIAYNAAYFFMLG